MHLEQIDAPWIPNVRKEIKRLLRARHTERWSYSPNSLPRAVQNVREHARMSAQWLTAERAGLVRLCAAPDEHADYANLAGDTYDVKLNADSVPGGARTIIAQEKAFKRQIERDGVFGVIGQYRLSPGDKWLTSDSCWGFVGTFDDSGAVEYAWDIMAQTLEELRNALRDRCPTCRRPRPHANCRN